ncbi:hypothetical protein ACP70R_043031 [Stipagrostis hirtigluma subsp. patula]
MKPFAFHAIPGENPLINCGRELPGSGLCHVALPSPCWHLTREEMYTFVPATVGLLLILWSLGVVVNCKYPTFDG